VSGEYWERDRKVTRFVTEDSVLISQLPAGFDFSPLWELMPCAGEMVGRLFVFYNVGIPSTLTKFLVIVLQLLLMWEC